MDNQEKGFFEEFTEMAKKILKGVFKLFKLKTIIIIGVILITILLLTAITYITTLDEGLFDPNDEGNVPNNVKQHNQSFTVNEDGTLHRGQTIQELWDEMVSNGSNIELYLSGPEELAKLVNAETVTQNIDTREEPGSEIDWTKFNAVDTTETVGIVELKRADSNGDTYNLEYMDPATFYENINIYNTTEDENEKEKAKEQAMTHFTLERPAVIDGKTRVVNGEEAHIISDTADISYFASDDRTYYSGSVKVIGNSDLYKVGDIIYIETQEEGYASLSHQRAYHIVEVEHSTQVEEILIWTTENYVNTEVTTGFLDAEVYNVLDSIAKNVYQQRFRDVDVGGDDYTYIWPTEGETITSKFGYRDEIYDDNGNYVSGGKDHTGIDIAPITTGVDGDNIYAISDGEVVTSKVQTSGGTVTGYGEYIKIKHTDGTYSLYAHGVSGSRTVEVGDTVKQGDVIMQMGTTGTSTGVHVHFETQDQNGTPIDPLQFMYNIGSIGLGNESVAVIATFETVEKIVEKDIRGEKSEDYSLVTKMSTTDVDYKEVTKEYTMPFDFLWALLVIGQDKDFVLELADLVLDSEIEIVAYDTTVIDIKTSINDILEDEYILGDEGQESHSGTEDSKIEETKITTKNTVDLKLTKAYTWIVDYLAEFEFESGEEIVLADTEYDGELGGISYVTEEESDADGNITSTTNYKYVVIENKFKVKETRQKSTYVALPVEETLKIDPDADTPNFVNIYNKSDYAQVRGNIDTASEWLFQIIATNTSTSDMLDLLKFLLFQATGTNYGVTNYDVNEYLNRYDGTTSVAGTLDIFDTSMSREEFMRITLADNNASKFGEEVLGTFYDVSVEMGINPVIVVAHAALETGWGDNLSGSYNYFGYAAYNGKKGKSYSSVEESVVDYCEWLINSSTPGTSQYGQRLERAQLYSTENSIFNGTPDTNIYALYSQYAYLGDTHGMDNPTGSPDSLSSYIGGDSNSGDGGRYYIFDMYGHEEYVHVCGDNEGHKHASDPTTTKEQADYAEYAMNKRLDIAKDIFGNSIFVGAFTGETVVAGTNGEYNFPTYDQTSYPAGSSNISQFGAPDIGRTLSSGGCGPTTLAILVSGLNKDSSITPISVIDDLNKASNESGTGVVNGGFASGGANTSSMFNSKFMSTYYNLLSEITTDTETVLEAIADGATAIGRYPGHIMAVVPVTEQESKQGYIFRVIDPYKGRYSGLYKSIEDFNSKTGRELGFRGIVKPK